MLRLFFGLLRGLPCPASSTRCFAIRSCRTRKLNSARDAKASDDLGQAGLDMDDWVNMFRPGVRASSRAAERFPSARATKARTDRTEAVASRDDGKLSLLSAQPRVCRLAAGHCIE